jgi:hypothetical protein
MPATDTRIQQAIGAFVSDLEALIRSKLHRYIASHPGQRIEQIGKALGETTKDLRLPAQKLIAEKLVKTKGARRGMTYSPA